MSTFKRLTAEEHRALGVKFKKLKDDAFDVCTIALRASPRKSRLQSKARALEKAIGELRSELEGELYRLGDDAAEAVGGITVYYGKVAP